MSDENPFARFAQAGGGGFGATSAPPPVAVSPPSSGGGDGGANGADLASLLMGAISATQPPAVTAQSVAQPPAAPGGFGTASPAAPGPFTSANGQAPNLTPVAVPPQASAPPSALFSDQAGTASGTNSPFLAGGGGELPFGASSLFASGPSAVASPPPPPLSASVAAPAMVTAPPPVFPAAAQLAEAPPLQQQHQAEVAAVAPETPVASNMAATADLAAERVPVSAGGAKGFVSKYGFQAFLVLALLAIVGFVAFGLYQVIFGNDRPPPVSTTRALQGGGLLPAPNAPVAPPSLSSMPPQAVQQSPMVTGASALPQAPVQSANPQVMPQQPQGGVGRGGDEIAALREDVTRLLRQQEDIAAAIRRIEDRLSQNGQAAPVKKHDAAAQRPTQAARKVQPAQTASAPSAAPQIVNGEWTLIQAVPGTAWLKRSSSAGEEMVKIAVGEAVPRLGAIVLGVAEEGGRWVVRTDKGEIR